MKNRKKLLFILFPLLILLILLGRILCHPSFSTYTSRLFRQELAQDTITLHYTLSDPEAYGFKNMSASLGDFTYASFQKRIQDLKDQQVSLQNFLDQDLSEQDAMTAELLDWWLTGQIEMEDFYYFQEPLGPTLGVQAQLPVLLAEFAFRKEADVDLYLDLLKQLPDYFAQIIDFEREKASHGMFLNGESLDQILAQCNAMLTVDEQHFLITSFSDRLRDCSFVSDSHRTAYEIRNRQIINDYVVPAYQSLITSLGQLRSAQNQALGLYHTPGGLSYFEHLLKYTVGTDLTISQIRRLLDDQMETDYETVYEAIAEGIDLLEHDAITTTESYAAGSSSTSDSDTSGAESTQDASTAFSPLYILLDLQKKINKDFPTPPDTNFQVKTVPDSLAPYLSPAFYLTPPVDATKENTIYINPSQNTDTITLLTTLAHEGYPGHLYQHTFEQRDSYDPIRSLIYVGGYTEGWGLYSELYAYDFLDMNRTKANALRALSSLNYAICASLDLSVHGMGWNEAQCVSYLASFGITDTTQIHKLYLQLLEEPGNYLKYYLGYLEICKLKESALALSSNWSLYDFHNWFLTTGPAPFSILTEHLENLEISSKLLERMSQDFHLLSVQPFHDGRNHFLVKRRMLLVG